MKKNIFKGYITTLIGIAICGLTYFEINKGVFTFIWEGIAGFTLGAILIISPDDLISTVKSVIGKIFNKKTENN